MSRLILALSLILGALLPLSAGFALAAQQQPVSVVDTTGTEAASVSVNEIVDPFEHYLPGNPPQRGYHFVLVDTAVENTGPRDLNVDPSDFILRDSDGFLYGTSTVYRPEEIVAADLAYQDLPPGSSAEGTIGFQVLTGVDLAELLLRTDNGQLITLAAFGEPPPVAIGDPVSLESQDGSAIGEISVENISDPFVDFEDGSPAGRGSHYVVIEAFADNSGQRAWPIDPGRIFLQDSEGFLYAPASVPLGELPPMAYGDVAPGAKTAGAIGYSVIDGVELVRILYQPANDRLLVLADLAGGAASSGADTAASPTVESAGSASIDCVASAEWLQVVVDESSSAVTVAGAVTVMIVTDDPELAESGHQIAQAFQGTGSAVSSDPPEGAADLAQALGDALIAYGDALEARADAVDAGDAAGLAAAGQALFDAEPALISTTEEMAALAEECDISASS